MPRKPRRELAGGVFHVFARGVDRRRIFLDDLDRQMYLHLLGGVSRRQEWACLAYCLMDNHMHALLQTPEPNLGAGMRRLNGTYAQVFNERYARSGHLFERRFNDRGIASVRSIVTVAAYIAANPVEAHLVATPEAWPWSSHAALAAGTEPRWLDAARLHALIEAEGGDATERYLAALAERVAAAREGAAPQPGAGAAENGATLEPGAAAELGATLEPGAVADSSARTALAA